LVPNFTGSTVSHATFYKNILKFIHFKRFARHITVNFLKVIDYILTASVV
jgi:hypothetical protein